MKEVLLHKSLPGKVTKFKVRETTTTEKFVTGTKLLKSEGGIGAFNKYKSKFFKSQGIPLTKARNFKLCSKHRNDVFKCLEKRKTQKKTRKRRVARPSRPTTTRSPSPLRVSSPGFSPSPVQEVPSPSTMASLNRSSLYKTPEAQPIESPNFHTPLTMESSRTSSIKTPEIPSPLSPPPPYSSRKNKTLRRRKRSFTPTPTPTERRVTRSMARNNLPVANRTRSKRK